MCLPCYEASGQPKRSRIVVSLRGRVVVAKDPEGEAALLAEQERAWAESGDLVQNTPLEMPCGLFRPPCREIEVQELIAQVARAAGGAVESQKAARGNAARTIARRR